jgi:ribosome maturation factor RimP
MIVGQLREMIEERVTRRGAHVLDFVVRGEGDDRVFEVFIDAEGGITSNFCSDVSRDLHRALEGTGTPRGSYRLTVSSPGISRPLKFPWQYMKHIGRYVHVKARSGDGHRDTIGKLISFHDNGIEVEVNGKNQHLRFAFDVIVEARVKAPW